MPAGGPLSFQPPAPPSACDFSCPLPRNGATEMTSLHHRHHPAGIPRRRGSCLVIATRRLLPGEGVGSACLCLRRFRRGESSLPRPVPASPPTALTHAPGNEVPADPAAASRCSLRSRLPLPASVSSRRLRWECGSCSASPICRRQPPRLRSLPVARITPRYCRSPVAA